MCVYTVLTLARVILSFRPFGFAVLCKYTVIHVVGSVGEIADNKWTADGSISHNFRGGESEGPISN